ncbi:WXG100 family type VII secretion target [Serinibacter arcticus]|uniref:ESAT-6-like protein n=1 Tax=Serinibacter arcticus TaxID=1655435 RepID=A0A2U1ZU98_9MICO|nr:WXG100 family type VII secretion target [Serinibacter arcticus]PWD50523.1 WXG100 family type VII secretion target [Serinibacter arcticus]
MAADKFSAEEGALRAGADHVATAKTTLDGQLADLRGRLTSLEGQWRGSGATAFTTVMTRWDNDTRRLTGALETFEANLKGTDTAYTETDDSAQQAMNAFNSSLTGN